MKNLILSTIAVLFVLIVALSACDDHNIPNSKTYVLVHGAWQAPFAWQIVKDQLEKQGQKVVLVELPGHGADNTPPQNLTLDVYRDKVISTINSLSGNVILVGHSLGGMVISAAAEKLPTRIDKLVYLGAFLPANGQSLLDLANTDADALLGPALRPTTDNLLLGIETKNLAPIFIQDGSAEVQKLIIDNYRPEPAIPFTNPAVLTAANFGRVPKYYLHTLQDHVVSPSLQKRMVAAAGVQKEYDIVSSHTAHLAHPAEVTRILMEIGQ